MIRGLGYAQSRGSSGSRSEINLTSCIGHDEARHAQARNDDEMLIPGVVGVVHWRRSNSTPHPNPLPVRGGEGVGAKMSVQVVARNRCCWLDEPCDAAKFREKDYRINLFKNLTRKSKSVLQKGTKITKRRRVKSFVGHFFQREGCARKILSLRCLC